MDLPGITSEVKGESCHHGDYVLYECVFRYGEASESLGECRSGLDIGATSPPLLPPPSSLHLLHAYCEVCSGEGVWEGGGEGVMTGKVMCEELLESPSSATILWRSEVMCLLATATLYLGECAKSRHWSLR